MRINAVLIGLMLLFVYPLTRTEAADLDQAGIVTSDKPMAGNYMSRHKLTTAGTVRKSLTSLVNADHIASDENGLISLTDPLMTRWLNTRWGKRSMLRGLVIQSPPKNY